MLKNVGSNWTLNALQILVFLVLARFVLDALGLQQTGVWGAVVAALGPLQLLALGIPMASVRFVSAHVARGETDEANRVLATCLAVTLAMGAAALALAALMFLGFDAGLLASDRWGLDAAQAADARFAFGLMALHVGLGFALRLPYGVFDAHQDFVARNLVQAAGLLLRLGLTLALLSWRADLVTLAAVQLGVAVAECVAAVLLSRHRHAGVRLSLRGVDRSRLRGILAFSGFAMLLNMGALLAFRLDALVVGAHLDEAAIAVYDYGNKVFEPFLGVVLAIGMVVMPLATRLEAQGRREELEAVLRKWTKIASSLVLCIGLWLLVLGPAFLEWWLGAEYVPQMGFLLQVLVVSFLAFLPVRGVALPILMGTGRQTRPAVALVVMGAVNLGLSLALVGPLGLTGVALGTALPNVFFAAYVLAVAARAVGTPALVLLGHGFLRPLLGASLPAALLLLADEALHLEGFVALLLSGLAYVALFGVMQVAHVWRGDPDLDLWALARARLRRRKGTASHA